ncbi:phosphonate metabolism transcriptional regulator PhnF [Gryllotalpicola reticulitermitis]|uniref:Phosphonate metabolism transcriptional regulator PhnF n=1 Tax=Gryllotalpicola reticulitermitis TaxID=1184153 RepID=A0ABV8QA84_9MICO
MSTQSSRSPSGYSTWRLIAEELRREIADGAWPAGAKLPSENDLAARFEVHRNTVRQAVAALVADGLVTSKRGSGTFVAEHTLLVHRIGARTRLTDSLRGSTASARLLDSAIEPDPPADIAERLRLDGRPALRLEQMRLVDGQPISLGTQWWVAEQVPGLPEIFARLGTVTGSLKEIGIADYLRAATTVGGRYATADEAELLRLAPGSVVLVVRSLDTLTDGTPLQFGIARFAAARVELDIEHARIG